jgi:U3 small nucleolar RNA-associated protein 12
LLLGQKPETYALNAIAKVRPSELEQAILCLPFDFAHEILTHLTTWLHSGQKVELTCKIAALVMRLHANSFGRTPETRRTLVTLRPLLRSRAKEVRDLMGFNLAGLGVLDAFIRDNEEVKDDFGDADAGF